MELVPNLSVSRKLTGDTLYAKDVNGLISSIESLTRAVNTLLKRSCDVNLEENDPNGKYTLEEAINYVPESRRVPGLLLRFRMADGKYYQFTYNSDDTDPMSWGNKDNWGNSVTIIDGGEI